MPLGFRPDGAAAPPARVFSGDRPGCGERGMIWLLAALLVLLAAAGAPLFAVLGALALIGFHQAGQDGVAVAVEFYRLSDMPALIAIPLFTLAGYLRRAPRRAVCGLTNALVGWLPGGLAIVAAACTLFTAFHRRHRRYHHRPELCCIPPGARRITARDRPRSAHGLRQPWLLLVPPCRLSCTAWWRSSSTPRCR